MWVKLLTLCSPDPQAFRPPEEPTNVLQVALPTNFKAARFSSEEHTAILRQMQADIEGVLNQKTLSIEEGAVLKIKTETYK